MSEMPREPREVWNEVGRQFGELGRILRGHLSPDAARTPSDPTDVPDPERPGWAGPTEVTADPDRAAWADPATADAGPVGADRGRAGPTAAGPGPARPGEAEGVADPWAAATDPGAGRPGADGQDTGTTADPGRGGATGQDTGITADPGAGRPGWTGYASGHQSWRGRTGWGTGGPGGSRWAGPAGGAPGWARTGVGRTDWEAMRESVRRLGESAQRLATQAGDAARDPEVLDSAQRAARTLGDAVTSTVEGLATELRERVRSPRWSDPSRPRPAERPPAAPGDDDPTP